MTIWPSMPDCGTYLVWPSEGTDWIHPEDIALAEKWIPSTRVFRRDCFDGIYYRLWYGDQSIRVKPTMWRKIHDEGFLVGDRVEILSHFSENEPCIGVITEIRFEKATNRVVYSIESRELPIPRPFLASDLMQLTKRPQLEPNDRSGRGYESL